MIKISGAEASKLASKEREVDSDMLKEKLHKFGGSVEKSKTKDRGNESGMGLDLEDLIDICKSIDFCGPKRDLKRRATLSKQEQ